MAREMGTVANAVLRIQHVLLDHGAPSERHLIEAAALLSLPDYSDVVIERNISSMCGFPLCSNQLSTSSSHKTRPRYRISLSEHRVYDLEEINKFCSEKCLISSKAYEASLSDKRSYDLSRDKIDSILESFEGEHGELGLGFEKSGDMGMKEVKIVEKEGGVNGEINIDEWIGSEKAIEGYVPKFDWDKGSKYGVTSNPEMGFTSEMSDRISSSETKDISDEISRKLNNVVLAEKNDTKNKNKEAIKSSPKPTKPEKNGVKNDLRDFTSERIFDYGSDGSSSCGTKDISEEILRNLENIVLAEKNKETSKFSPKPIEPVQKGVKTDLKPSLKKNEGSSVVSEAGIVILPQPHYQNKKETSENKDDFAKFDTKDANENKDEFAKWPKKPVLLETDSFDTDDSWHDTPPEGFSLTLSPFATIWMSIFEWVTCSSIAFIYGHGENQAEEFSEVKGRKYPHKIVLQDGQSAEIRKALEFFLCQAVPVLVSDLGVTVPVSTLEKNLALLINTMSFLEALPSLRMKQWRVIVLLFLDALSAYHLPSLAPITANRTALSQKVLNAAQITGEEYDSMISLFLPLGRSFESTPPTQHNK